jgi:hypothetical protein
MPYSTRASSFAPRGQRYQATYRVDKPGGFFAPVFSRDAEPVE